MWKTSVIYEKSRFKSIIIQLKNALKRSIFYVDNSIINSFSSGIKLSFDGIHIFSQLFIIFKLFFYLFNSMYDS